MNYTHQCWITEDQHFLLLDDELDERSFGHRTKTYIWDIVKDVSRGPWKKNGTLHSVIRVSYQAATFARSRTSLRRW